MKRSVRRSSEIVRSHSFISSGKMEFFWNWKSAKLLLKLNRALHEISSNDPRNVPNVNAVCHVHGSLVMNHSSWEARVEKMGHGLADKQFEISSEFCKLTINHGMVRTPKFRKDLQKLCSHAWHYLV